MRGACALAFAAATAALSPAVAQRGASQAQAFAQQQQILREIQYAVQSVAARVEAMEQRQAALADRVSALERAPGGATRDELAALRSDLAAVKAAQGRLRGEIVDDLSARISALAERRAKAREAERPRVTRGAGYSHTVEAGQTLSAIAQAYKVSVRAIMEANGIKDPTKLQVGQTLFIPDP